MKAIIGEYSDNGDREIDIVIDPYDSWSADHTMALIILPLLKQLRTKKHCSPGDMLEFMQCSYNNGCQRSFDFYGEGDEAANEAGHARWGKILDHIIWSFQMLVDEDEVGLTAFVTVEGDGREFEDMVDENSIWIGDGTEYDWAGYTAHQQKIQEGFDLFGKYYQNLWD